MSFWAGVGSAVSSLAGPLVSFVSQERTNKSNERIAEDTSEFNAEQAALNRSWQEKMSNTAYQRSMTDMRKAGLNPILAYQQGGASSGPGSSAQGVAAQMHNPGEAFARNNAISDAVEAYKKSKEAKLQDALITKTLEETAVTEINKKLLRNSLKISDETLNDNINSARQGFETSYYQSYNAYLKEMITNKFLNNAQIGITEFEEIPDRFKKGVSAFGRKYFSVDALLEDAESIYNKIKNNYNNSNWKGN